MQLGRRSSGTVLLTLGFLTVALLTAMLAISMAAAPLSDVAYAAAPSPTETATNPGSPTRPSNLRPCPVPLAPLTEYGYASICWDPSSDATGVAGYDLYRLDADGFVLANTTTATIGGFSGVLNRRYTMYVVARDAEGHVSPPSALITVTATLGMTPTASPTPEPGDHTPPSQPTDLRDACLQDYRGVTFCWQPSTDNVAVTAYDVYRETATTYAKVGTVLPSGFLNFAESADVVVGQRYTYFVVARDAAGNVSVPSAPLSALAREGFPTPTPTCSVSYRAATWSSLLNAEITVRNIGTTPIDGWTLTVDYPASSVQLTSGWSADWTQTGTRLTGKNRQWNKVIPVGSTTQIGFTASYTGSQPAPVNFALNGRLCTAA
ncbi:cellulose binding domain-containing protein [Streptosporangium saharense]|uniref:Cellulose 1,4-beta-cellobiosidase n=1 Tax=Streptosporangium saharense TaxID=1706840 RepID=A0A7W7QGL5_9ACTN|nr:cellulose binding domain-containing protein [Streptosporangium saharense]MBB4913222.1 cellulose 1,4-beta-cellobiosidase [Streptosporangium saharense]